MGKRVAAGALLLFLPVVGDPETGIFSTRLRE